MTMQNPETRLDEPVVAVKTPHHPRALAFDAELALCDAAEEQEHGHVHGASPSHDEGAWCSYGTPGGCGLFLPLSSFKSGYAAPYFADVRTLIPTSLEATPWQDELRQQIYREMSTVFEQRRVADTRIAELEAQLAEISKGELS